MIAIFSQEGTWIHKDADDARARLIELYGSKLGLMAYERLRDAPLGSSFRENGGALVQVIDKEKASWFMEKEAIICSKGE